MSVVLDSLSLVVMGWGLFPIQMAVYSLLMVGFGMLLHKALFR